MKRVFLRALLFIAASSTAYATNTNSTCICSSASPNAPDRINTFVLQNGKKVTAGNKTFDKQHANDLLDALGVNSNNTNRQKIVNQIVGIGTAEAMQIVSFAVEAGIIAVAPELAPIAPIIGALIVQIKPKDVANVINAARKSGAKTAKEMEHALKSAASITKKIGGKVGKVVGKTAGKTAGRAVKKVGHTLGKLHIHL